MEMMRIQARIKTLGGPMPKDRGGPDQGIFQDLWTGGCKRRTGGDDLFFLLATPERG
jgi:hypothetical protein